VAAADPALRFVQWGRGITPSQPQGFGSPPAEQGFFAKAGSALKQSGANVGSRVKSLFPSGKPAAEPTAPDPWTNSKKKRNPDPSLFVALARLQEQGGNLPVAQQYYNRALEKDPKNVEALLGLAHLTERMGHPDKALELYQKATRYHPQDPAAHNDLGICYLHLGKMAEAVTSFERAIALEPRRKLYRNNIARPLVAMGRLNDAYAQLSAVYQPAVVYYNLGYLLNDRGDYRAAYEHFERALAINPQFAEAQSWRAQLGPRVGALPRTQQSPPRQEHVARQIVAPMSLSHPASAAAPPDAPSRGTEQIAETATAPRPARSAPATEAAATVTAPASAAPVTTPVTVAEELPRGEEPPAVAQQPSDQSSDHESPDVTLPALEDRDPAEAKSEKSSVAASLNAPRLSAPATNQPGARSTTPPSPQHARPASGVADCPPAEAAAQTGTNCPTSEADQVSPIAGPGRATTPAESPPLPSRLVVPTGPQKSSLVIASPGELAPRAERGEEDRATGREGPDKAGEKRSVSSRGDEPAHGEKTAQAPHRRPSRY
jgi:tetratricopeptide (TPR) repeat protein